MIRICLRHSDPRLFARSVCFIRGGDVAHAEVAWRWVADVHECVSATWREGVRGIVLPMPASKWRIYEVPGEPADVEKWAKEHDGEHYDWPAYFGFTAFRRLKGLLRWWFCFEIAALHAGLRAPHRFDGFDLETVLLRLCAAGVARRVQ